MTHIGRIKVIKEQDDIFESECICPHCGSKAIYGEMFTISGVNGCPNCHEELSKTIDFDRKKSI